MSPKKIIKSCPVCNAEFISYKCENKKICSRKCFSGYMKQHPEIYEHIKLQPGFKGKKHTVESKAKMRKASLKQIAEGKRDMKAMSELARPFNTGKNNVNWKGGVTSKDRIERIKFRKTMQKNIFERDNYTCVKCNVVGGSLSVDHIKSWADYPQLRFTEDNCQTLCMECHYEKTFGKPKPEGLVWGHNLKKAESWIAS